MVAKRRQGREWALQFICQAEVNPPEDLDRAIDEFWRQQWTVSREAERAEEAFSEESPFEAPPDAPAQVAPDEIRAFAEARVRGVLGAVAELDKLLAPYLENWEMYRLGTVERNVLRLGAWELVNCPDVPPPVVINEAVDIAKYFSNTESGRFVNGVLDRLHKQRR